MPNCKPGEQHGAAARHHFSSAFTLIELLIVVAIVAIIASILFPVFGRVRENARRASCQSNLKQIGLGVLQYAQDFDDTWPQYTVTGVVYIWADAVYPYVRNEQVYNCPSHTFITNETQAYKFNMNRGSTDYTYGSYGINFAYLDADVSSIARTPPTSNYITVKPVTTSMIIQPSTTVWVTDSLNSITSVNSYRLIPARETGSVTPAITAGPPRYLTSSSGANVSERHLKTTNVLWCDGHVKAVPLEQLLQTNGSGTYRSWTIEDD